MASQKDIKKALAAASAVLGKEIELPPETAEDLLREGQSVLNYFTSRGEGFSKKECKVCHLIFAYAYNVETVSYCSIPCMRKALQDIGLDWNPSRPIHLRWGRFVPAVVPPQALAVLDDILAVLPPDTSS